MLSSRDKPDCIDHAALLDAIKTAKSRLLLVEGTWLLYDPRVRALLKGFPLVCSLDPTFACSTVPVRLLSVIVFVHRFSFCLSWTKKSVSDDTATNLIPTHCQKRRVARSCGPRTRTTSRTVWGPWAIA